MRDDLITLLIAGHETTAAVLTWLVYALSQHPEALKVVQQEIDEVVGDRYASGRASDREPARRRTATPLLTHPAILLRPQVRDGRGHQEDARGAESDRRDAADVAGAAAPHSLRDRGGLRLTTSPIILRAQRPPRVCCSPYPPRHGCDQ